ncbi:MAG TPA: ABC transporter ATP-binding protein [Polyangia bacterium]|nr:ABC transporter ATP-binding protein [Polyangia bacterium]
MNRDERYQIQIRGIEKTFGAHHVLRGVDLDVERGKINIIIGGSGQGKSVLMKHLMGLLKPDKGQIWVDGEDIVPLDDFELNRVRLKFGMSFQYSALFDSLTVEENVAFPLFEHRSHMSKREIHDTVIDKLRSLGLENVEKKYPAEISGGMRKRVGLARALVLKPEILLYDEPTTGLDPIATKNVDDMIRDISKETGVTSVVISHDMASTFRIADRISMLNEGRIVASGTPDEILVSQNEFLKAFVEMSGSVRMKGTA